MKADTINTFNNRLDKREVFYDFNADLTGTGSLPICIWLYDRQDVAIGDYMHTLELIVLALPIGVCMAKRGRNIRLAWLANPNPNPNHTNPNPNPNPKSTNPTHG